MQKNLENQGLMTSLVKLTNSKHGSIGFHWFLKKMNWTPSKVERFQFQREMRLKFLHMKKLVKVKKIMVDSIKDHLIPQVSSLKTPMMFDSLTKLVEGKNRNKNMTLRNQLKNMKIQNAETIQSYFKRVSQIKEQLEAVKEEVKNEKVVIATLNGILGSWD